MRKAPGTPRLAHRAAKPRASFLIPENRLAPEYWIRHRRATRKTLGAPVGEGQYYDYITIN